MRTLFRVAAAAALLSAAGCVEMPAGPTVAVMPAPYKPFDQFAADDAYCREYAQSRVVPAEQQARRQAVGTAVAGTALGAAAGGLIGNSARSAGVGTGVGMVAGSMAGAGHADRAGSALQRSYDLAYEQCMYARGNQVPGYAPITPAAPPPPAPPPPPVTPAR